MKLEKLSNKKILIVGYGIEGKSVEVFLRKTVPSAIVDITNDTDGPDYLEKQKEYDLVIKSPGVKKASISVPYTTATNIFFANIRNTVIGVTGTKGKSTTASLIHHMLTQSGKRSHLVGNIGSPALDLLLLPLPENDIVVMELSSYQLDDVFFSPHFIIITSLFPEHMNYHGNTAAYYTAKKNILNNVKSDDVVFYNSKYSHISQWLELIRCKKIDVKDLSLGSLTVQLIGEHNRENMLLVYAVGKELQIPNSVILNALTTFKPLPHRLEKIGKYNGIIFYDDAISTTPESTISAIDSLKNIDTLLLGGQDRGYDFTRLVDSIIQNKIRNIVLFPDSGEKIFTILSGLIPDKINILRTDNMKEAVDFAFKMTKKDHICLLSTASPSYTLWKNYIEKGDLFKQYILDYEKS